MILYHITTEENYEKIKTEGIKPMIGELSRLAGEKWGCIFLCEYKDIAKWMKMLNRNVVLEVDMDDIPQKREYNLYDEYKYYHESILCNKVKRIYDYPKLTEEELLELQKDYIIALNQLVQNIMEYYYFRYDIYDKFYLIRPTIFVVNNLDYKSVDKEVIKKIIKSEGESGEYTFLDTYFCTNVRLYQQLLNFPTDDYVDLRRELSNCILENFDGCLDINTGGWMANL